jgi:hypothetical protein
VASAFLTSNCEIPNWPNPTGKLNVVRAAFKAGV